MADRTVIAATTFDGRTIPASDFPTLTMRDEIDRVVWDDGTSSWAKCWYFGNAYPDEMRPKVCKIGAGAYGTLTVWRHPEFRHA